MVLSLKEIEALDSIQAYLNNRLTFEWLKLRTSWVGDRWLQNGDEHYDTLAIPIEFSRRSEQEGYGLIRHTAKELYGLPPKSRVYVKGLHEIANCTMNPIRVTADIEGSEQQFFIKDPEPKRFYGKAFYNILMDGKFINFRANGGCVVSQHVPGTVFEDISENDYNHNNFWRNKARLDVFMNLILLYDVVGKERNYSVDTDGNIHLLDFNQSLQEGDHSFYDDTEVKSRSELQALRKIEEGKILTAYRRNPRTIQLFYEALKENNFEEELAYRLGEQSMADVVLKRIQQLQT